MGNLLDVIAVAQRVQRVIDQVETVIVGKRNAVELCLVALLGGGHVLIEDIPGVGKTTLAKALARSLGCAFKRIQFTPDMLPSDITGTSIFNQKNTTFEFHEGPIFANIVLADEINRATPKTQSALLEAMEESQITADGITYTLPAPFFVIATENNIEAHGTYALPEAQLDRFLIRMGMGYPARADEAMMLTRQTKGSVLDQVKPVVDHAELIELQHETREIYVDQNLREYIIELVNATREHPSVMLGASPRGSLALLHCAQSYAALRGRTYVLPDDIKYLLGPVLGHRLILRPEARLKTTSADLVLKEIAETVPVPTVR
ncbi:MAG: MoxR family ATPase [Capsulimonadaceae bacterium]|nr:MoxR family ATPase [Capsulimonadaceae bacterium]